MRVPQQLINQVIALANRYPWVIPTFAFASGLVSFFLVERKLEHFGQLISILMLVSWIWLAAEGLLQRGISHWFNIEIPPALLRYVTQLVHQESLFFVVPFFFITTAWNSGQLVFTSLLIVAAFISITDPIYYHWLAPRRWLYFIFHGITLFASLLTTLPLLFHLPTPQSYLWSLAIATLLTCPAVARSMSHTRWKRIVIFLLLTLTTCGLGFLVRPWIPPASLWLTQVAITDRISDENHSPNQPLKVITRAQLDAGVYAYTSIHAPRGLNERIYHQWRLNGKKLDKIPLKITGGREEGYRSWSHKMNFPADSIGNWQIYVMTEAEQVIGVLRFKVVDSPAQNKVQEVKTADEFSSAAIKTETPEVKTESAPQNAIPSQLPSQ